ncbi:RxLR effector protein [Phytophthora megakarya]|uniref:RxLR effector protein n=1 Tax=Phytophthora megakarya TaxID=4795 RepID=A0A225VKZ7_9STRA|nr:RxLR effector protein [Phytophthora megakarya]
MRVKYLFYQVLAVVLLASNTATIVTAIEDSGTSKGIENSQIAGTASRLLRVHESTEEYGHIGEKERRLTDLTKSANTLIKDTKFVKKIKVLPSHKKLIDFFTQILSRYKVSKASNPSEILFKKLRLS